MRIVTFHMDQLGDLLFSLPALYALRQTHPEARIVGVVRPSLAELLRKTELIDGVLQRAKGWRDKIRLLSELRRERFDIAVCFSQARECVLLPWATRVPRRVGFEGSHFEELLTERVPLSGPPSLAANLTLPQQLGCSTPKRDYIDLLHVSDEQRREGSDLLREAGWDATRRLAFVAPGASKRQGIKQWTDEGFAAIADRLSETMQVALVSLDSAEGITRRAKSRVLDLTGKTSLVQLAGVLSHAALFVGVDSGVMHLAAALDVPVVALFGPTDPRGTGPCGNKHQIVRNGWWCSPCHLKVCPYDHECLDRITPEQVWSTIEATGASRGGTL